MNLDPERLGSCRCGRTILFYCKIQSRRPSSVGTGGFEPVEFHFSLELEGVHGGTRVTCAGFEICRARYSGSAQCSRPFDCGPRPALLSLERLGRFRHACTGPAPSGDTRWTRAANFSAFIKARASECEPLIRCYRYNCNCPPNFLRFYSYCT